MANDPPNVSNENSIDFFLLFLDHADEPMETGQFEDAEM